MEQENKFNTAEQGLFAIDPLVLILDVLAPDSTREWFSGMTELYLIEGIEKLDVRFVTDMTDMFRDCYLMTDLPSWYLHHEGAA